MQYKVSELEGALLDRCVAGAEDEERSPAYRPSSDWATGGPIIERQQITLISPDDPLNRTSNGNWTARIVGTWSGRSNVAEAHGRTPLIAAMRAYVIAGGGDEIDLL